MTQSTGSRAVASMMDAVVNKEADYGSSIRDNYGRTKLVADRLMHGGGLEQALLKLAKEENPVITEEYVMKFLEEQRSRLKDVACQNVANQRTVDSFISAAKDIRQTALVGSQTQADGQDFTNYEDMIKENMNNDQAMKKASELAVEHEKFYRDVVERLGEKTSAKQGDEDEDIMLVNDGSGQARNLKCPITMTLLENPVVSKVCKHHYSRAAIENYIRTKIRGYTGRCKCPVAGCGNGNLTLEQLEEDKEMEMLVRRSKRQEQMQSQHLASQAEDLLDSDED